MYDDLTKRPDFLLGPQRTNEKNHLVQKYRTTRAAHIEPPYGVRTAGAGEY
jgi:hypothetical protein